MTLKETQLQKLYALKKKQDRLCRYHENLGFYKEQKAQLQELAGDTELMPLKKTTYEKDLKERLEIRNPKSRSAKRSIFIAVVFLLILALCVASATICVRNAQYLLDNGGFLPGYEPEEPQDTFDTPSFSIIMLVVLMGILLLLIMVLPFDVLAPSSGWHFAIEAVIILLLLAGLGITGYNLYLIKPFYLAFPAAALVLAIIYRIISSVTESWNMARLTPRQKKQIAKAAAQDEINRRENVKIQSQAKQQNLTELKPELARLDSQIEAVRNKIIVTDLQMRSVDILDINDFPSLNRLLELLESNQATDLQHALKLRDSEENAKRQKEAADQRRLQEQMAIYQMYSTMRDLRRQDAYRKQSAVWDQNFRRTQEEIEYRDYLQGVRDRQIHS